MTGSPAPSATAGAARAPRPARCARRPLGAYDRDGRRREIVARPGAYASVLVIDEDAATLGDRRGRPPPPARPPPPPPGGSPPPCRATSPPPTRSSSASSPSPTRPPAAPARCCPPTGGAR